MEISVELLLAVCAALLGASLVIGWLSSPSQQEPREYTIRRAEPPPAEVGAATPRDVDEAGSSSEAQSDPGALDAPADLGSGQEAGAQSRLKAGYARLKQLSKVRTAYRRAVQEGLVAGVQPEPKPQPNQAAGPGFVPLGSQARFDECD